MTTRRREEEEEERSVGDGEMVLTGSLSDASDRSDGGGDCRCCVPSHALDWW